MLESNTKIKIEDIWSSIRKRVESSAHYDLLSPWMNRLSLVEASDNSLRVSLNDKDLRPFLTKHHFLLLSEAAEYSLANRPSIFLREEENNSQLEYRPDDSGTKSSSIPGGMNPLSLPLIPEYTFHNFYIGPSNRLANAAAQAIIKKPGIAFNPFLIHGNTGLGKTHLVHALCLELKNSYPDKHILLTNGKTLVEQIEDKGKLSKIDFIKECCNTDVLIIDDIDYINTSKTTQEEFFHIFNDLHTSNCQLIFTSSKSPSNINDLIPQLVSRFRWGMMVELTPLSAATKKYIITKTAVKQQLDLDDSIIDFMAKNISGNIRDFEGAVNKIAGYTHLLHKDISADTIKQILKDFLIDSTNKTFTIKDIQEEVSSHYSVSIESINSKNRSRSLVLPRHIGMYICREFTSTSLEEIGQCFGNRDHSTVKHGCDKIQSLLEIDQSISSAIDSIKNKLLN